MAFRRSARGAVTRPGRKIDFKQWDFLPALSQNVTANATFLAAGFLSFLAPATILRIRGVIRVSFRLSGLTGDDACSLVFGMAVFSTDAVTLGPTALPDPAAEAEYPWIWWTDIEMFAPEMSNVTSPGETQHVIVDSKAMRKVKPGETLAIVGQYVDITGAPSMNIQVGRLRTLIGT